MIDHLIAFVLGFIMDQIIGDPYNIPHPIRLIGRGIGFFESLFLGKKKGNNDTDNPENIKGIDLDKKTDAGQGRNRDFICGVIMCVVMLILSGICTALILFTAYKVHRIIGIMAEAVLTCYILAAKSLRVESMKVYDALMKGSIEDARYAVSMIVGRDTDCLDRDGIAKAAVETVAENTSDGVIAPLLYTFIGGPVAGFLYKTINTMDSMVGYHNDRYEYFGKAAAKLDDVVNFLPARISAIFMILAAFICGKEYSGRGAFKIFKRDRFNHKSPNSAQTESACAGALSLRLAGDASYFGKIVKKPFVGDDIRHIEPEDIKRACNLMYATEYLCFITMFVIALLCRFIG